jgi:hypothetical protein
MLENKLHKIIVAHPDDEILFFNSIIPSAKEIILCYGPTSSEEVSAGREKLKSTYPFENVRFLDVIFTHNPWGEYGHPEHVQVFRAVHSLKAEFNLKIFVDGYVSDKTYGFMSKHYSLLSPQSFLGYPNNDLGQKVMEVYLRSNCWTWRKDYRWPSTEVFYKLADDNEATFAMPNNSSYPPLNILTRKFTHGPFKSFLSHGLWLLKSTVLKKF